MKLQKLMWIAWPAFLVAGLLEMLVFAMVDPQDLHWFGQPVELSRQGIYTIAFFVFWGITMLSSALTTLKPFPCVTMLLKSQVTSSSCSEVRSTVVSIPLRTEATYWSKNLRCWSVIPLARPYSRSA